MDKRYQVFISSTYEDLKVEREAVIKTLLKINCMPAGMELFPAADEEQFEFIKRVIDDSDYYLLIIGGRYGSISSEGISYTELEYNYAVEKGLKVLALVHGNPDEIVVGKTDKDAERAERLKEFRSKAQKSRLVSYWKDPNELKAEVVLGMLNMIRHFPAVGWMRASKAIPEDLLLEINQLRKDKAELLDRLKDEQSESKESFSSQIAGLQEKFTFSLTYRKWDEHGSRDTEFSQTWQKIFSLIAPHLISQRDERVVKELLAKAVLDDRGIDSRSRSISENDFQTIKVQFMAHGLIDVLTPGMSGTSYLKLSKAGHALMLAVCSVKRDK